MSSPKYNVRISGCLGCLVILLPLIITATAAALTTYLIFTY